jgi:hypothetical protein
MWTSKRAKSKDCSRIIPCLQSHVKKRSPYW